MNTKEKSAIVIGLGPAGLQASLTLLEAGYQVTALEARDRIGGRVFTSEALKPNNTPFRIEYGANWIHTKGHLNGKQNPLIPLADEADVKHIEQNLSNPLIFESNGKRMGFWKRSWFKVKILFQYLWNMIKHASLDIEDKISQFVKKKQNANAEHVTYGDALDKYIPRKRKPKESDSDLSFLNLPNLLRAYFKDLFGGHAPEDISAWEQVTHPEYDGNDDFVVGGYGKIMEHLKGKCEAYKEKFIMRLNTPISAITQTNKSISVTFNHETLTADSVISTLPIGVMKACVGSDEKPITFTPPLSDDKQTAIKKTLNGHMAKVFFVFKERFWKNADEKSHFILLMKEIGKNILEDKPWIGVVDYSELHPDSNTLLLTCYGEEATQALDKMIPYFEGILKETFGDHLPNYEAYGYIWAEDQYARCAWPMHGKDMTLNDIKALAANEGRLFFAGDMRANGTVHAALDSGKNAANELIAAFA